MYVMLKVSVHAPTILLPVNNEQAFMIDLGRIQLENDVDKIDTGLVVENYGMTLEEFKVSRYININIVTSFSPFPSLLPLSLES